MNQQPGAGMTKNNYIISPYILFMTCLLLLAPPKANAADLDTGIEAYKNKNYTYFYTMEYEYIAEKPS